MFLLRPTCLESALELLARLPNDEARARRELGIRFGLARALQLAVSFGGEEQQTNLARARELCIRLVDRPALALVLAWQSRWEFVRSNPRAMRAMRAMRAIAEMQRQIAPYLDDPEIALQIQQLGVSAGIEGELAEAEDQFNRTSAALADADPEHHEVVEERIVHRRRRPDQFRWMRSGHVAEFRKSGAHASGAISCGFWLAREAEPPHRRVGLLYDDLRVEGPLRGEHVRIREAELGGKQVDLVVVLAGLQRAGQRHVLRVTRDRDQQAHKAPVITLPMN